VRTRKEVFRATSYATLAVLLTDDKVSKGAHWRDECQEIMGSCCDAVEKDFPIAQKASFGGNWEKANTAERGREKFKGGGTGGEGGGE